jgi:hypothetical protein
MPPCVVISDSKTMWRPAPGSLSALDLCPRSQTGSRVRVEAWSRCAACVGAGLEPPAYSAEADDASTDSIVNRDGTGTVALLTCRRDINLSGHLTIDHLASPPEGGMTVGMSGH